jgi:hypothetical protein
MHGEDIEGSEFWLEVTDSVGVIRSSNQELVVEEEIVGMFSFPTSFQK